MVAAAAGGFIAWEGTLAQSSMPAHVSVLAVIALALAAAGVMGRSRQRRPSAAWLRDGAVAFRDGLACPGRRPLALRIGVAVWVVLAAATIGWDLTSFLHQSHSLPTLSRFVGAVTRAAWGRATVFAAWLALGAYLAAGGRRP